MVRHELKRKTEKLLVALTLLSLIGCPAFAQEVPPNRYESPVCSTPAMRLLSAYLKHVRREIAAWWKQSEFISNSPVLEFKLLKTGQVYNVKVLKSSNGANIDRAIIDKFRRIKFEAVPKACRINNYSGITMRIDLQTGETPAEYRTQPQKKIWENGVLIDNPGYQSP